MAKESSRRRSNYVSDPSVMTEILEEGVNQFPTSPPTTHTRVYARSSAELKRAMGEDSGAVDVQIDPLLYDLTAEAEERIDFSKFIFIEEILVNLISPLSVPYLYWAYGAHDLRLRGFLPPKAGSVKFQDTTSIPSRKSATPMFVFVSQLISNTLIKWLAVVGFFFGGYHRRIPGQTRIPLYYMILTGLCLVNSVMQLANKKALRRKASALRLELHHERRSEELLFGWLPLPWMVAVFELRMAAHQVRIRMP